MSTLQDLLARSQKRSTEEFKILQNRLSEFEINGPVLQEKLKIAKDQLGDLVISESVYVDFKAVPEHQRSLREHVTVQVSWR